MENLDEVVNNAMNSLGDVQSDTADNGIYSFDDSIDELIEIVNDNAQGKKKKFNNGDLSYLMIISSLDLPR